MGFKDRKPSTKEDEKFIKKKVRELFEKREIASRKSLEDYFTQHGLRPVNKDFVWQAQRILSDINRNIDIKILGNQISTPKLSVINIPDLLKREESSQLEFKSTFQWDVKKQQKNTDLKHETLKTIAAFNNTEGGYLLIGVEDNRNIFGLAKDYSIISKKNQDGFLLELTQEIENKISKDFPTKLNIKFLKKENKDICLVKVDFGKERIWINKNKKERIFYIRSHNKSIPLPPEEAADYIRKKWPQ